VTKDTPQPEKTVRERGTFAKHAGDPTLKSYLSSLFFLLSVPGLITLAVVGYWNGLYSYSAVVPVFVGLFVTSLAIVFALMHYTS
jgi:vacuolar-type H+-ATPase subunit I/STV1